MSIKPWGIFVPLKIQKIIYPKEKIEYEGPYILATLLRRVSVILTYYILNPVKISANTISLSGFFVSFFCLVSLINSNYFFGSFLSCFWVLLDNIDGELARLQKNSSNFGAVLEKLNSDIFYIFLFPALSIGLYKDNLVSLDIVIITFFALGSYNIFRVFLSNYPNQLIKGKINHSISNLIECQFKNSLKQRKKSKLGTFIFYSWRNIYAQCGLNELCFLLASILFVYNFNILPSFLIFFSFSYLFISSFLSLGLIVVSILSKKKNN